MKTQPIPPSFLKQFRNLIHNGKNFAVIAHFRPDGDALGATIAMGGALHFLGKQVTMLNEDAVPSNLKFMEGSESIIRTIDYADRPDAIIVLDNGDIKRIGIPGMALIRDNVPAPVSVNIDHHETNNRYADLNCILPEECSTCAILYHLFLALEIPLSPAMRDALYIGISTDTGSFQYERTTPEVMEIAADLLRQGVNVHDINRKLYQEIPWKKLMLNREVLNDIHLDAAGRVASFSLTRDCKNRLGVTEDDTDGLIDILRSIEGVLLAIFLEEMDNGKIRISLRSKTPAVSVSEIASRFGGGGHAMAAGIRMSCPIEEARAKVLPVLEEAVSLIS